MLIEADISVGPGFLWRFSCTAGGGAFILLKPRSSLSHPAITDLEIILEDSLLRYFQWGFKFQNSSTSLSPLHLVYTERSTPPCAQDTCPVGTGARRWDPAGGGLLGLPEEAGHALVPRATATRPRTGTALAQGLSPALCMSRQECPRGTRLPALQGQRPSPM